MRVINSETEREMNVKFQQDGKAYGPGQYDQVNLRPGDSVDVDSVVSTAVIDPNAVAVQPVVIADPVSTILSTKTETPTDPVKSDADPVKTSGLEQPGNAPKSDADPVKSDADLAQGSGVTPAEAEDATSTGNEAPAETTNEAPAETTNEAPAETTNEAPAEDGETTK